MNRQQLIDAGWVMTPSTPLENAPEVATKIFEDGHVESMLLSAHPDYTGEEE